MPNYVITPEVNQTQEFIEIANDFSNPLDLVREAISNSIDANATQIEISFDVVMECGERILKIRLFDNGDGMDAEGLKSFFDLGNSLHRGNENKIGEKGHGTKVYFNSTKIEVITTKNNITSNAIIEKPLEKLFNQQIPVVNVTTEETPNQNSSTEIIIKGYNNNRRDKFVHNLLKDYILWFTKFGSIEKQFNIDVNSAKTLFLKGIDRETLEEINFGHYFPEDSRPVRELFEEYIVAAPDYYCKRHLKTGQLRNFPEIQYQALFCIEGNKIKQEYNQMLRRAGKARVTGDYTVQERYGLWLSKDFIPIQKKNEWITYKGSEYIKFHAFFNCQDFKLTANRGSIENTPSEILEDIKNEVKGIFDSIMESNDWIEMTWLEEEANAYKTAEKERKDFEWRKSKILKSNICIHKNIVLVEPERESGVFALVQQLSIIEPTLFPFTMLDYDTHSGLDVIVKSDNTTPITVSALYYVEFKQYLTLDFNHSFSNLCSIICWDTTIKHDDYVKDINGEERRMQITQPQNENDYTRYYLVNPRSIHNIEVYVLKDYLREKLHLEFRPRTDRDAF
jgi:hypothetical protein